MEKKKVEKKYFDVVIESLVPAKLSFRVLAETPEEAIKLSEKMAPREFVPNIRQHKKLKVVVKDAGTLNVRLSKSFRG